MSEYIEFTIRIPKSAIEDYADGFCRGKSIFGVKEPDACKFVQMAMLHWSKGHLSKLYRDKFVKREIDAKQALPEITVTYKEINE